ncbi:MAG: hypothetical protein CBB66_03980 [bacterium TMED6]|nr:MAG: hypothetical protein CBB66_03980 [bacterium TMED6]|tara:strand:+ start:10141 stop:10326 length:186 start_codon:yes stop_codon:yes gene_type:complete
MPSLKHFHIFFVIVSMALCMFFCYWAFNNNMMQYFYLSIISFLLIGFYGIKFYSKIKELGL